MEKLAEMLQHTEDEGDASFSPQEENLVAKLVAAVSAVDSVEKRGYNENRKYHYTMATDVARALRGELFSRGVLLIPNEVHADIVQYETGKGTKMRECTLEVNYTVTDGKQTLVFGAFGVGSDTDDKAIYKAKTGALKYFLKGLGLIPDESDDAENDIPRSASTSPPRAVEYTPKTTTKQEVVDNYDSNEGKEVVEGVILPYAENGDSGTATFTVLGVEERDGQFGKYPYVSFQGNGGGAPYYSKWGNEEVLALNPGSNVKFRVVHKGKYTNLQKLLEVF